MWTDCEGKGNWKRCQPRTKSIGVSFTFGFREAAPKADATAPW